MCVLDLWRYVPALMFAVHLECVCVFGSFYLPVSTLKVNVYTDNEDDVLESVHFSIWLLLLQCITELINMMEQAP